MDRRYKHSLCRSCFLERRAQAAQALDAEWFLANVPFDQLTAHEREATGIATLTEYDAAKKRPEPDGTEDGKSTLQARGLRPKEKNEGMH